MTLMGILRCSQEQEIAYFGRSCYDIIVHSRHNYTAASNVKLFFMAQSDSNSGRAKVTVAAKLIPSLGLNLYFYLPHKCLVQMQ